MPVGCCPFYWQGSTLAWYKGWSMKTLRFLPLTFIAGAHGFPIFVSYLALVLTIVQIHRICRS